MGDKKNMSWETDIRLVTNPNIVKAWLKAMLATYVLIMLIMATIFIGTGEYDSLPMLAGIFALVVVGLFVLGLVIMLVVLGNRYRARFTVSDEGILYESLDTRANTLARLTVVAGLLSGRAGVSGAGMLAVAEQQVQLRWPAVFAARFQSGKKTIILRNQWRDLMHIYCTEENYADVAALVEQQINVETREKVQAGKSPLPWAILHTTLVLLACLLLFALHDLTKLDVFVPIFMMAFSLATIWLIPLFGWVILPSVGYVLIQISLHLVEMREYTLVNTYRFRGYEALDVGEWFLLCLSLLGLGYLTLIAWRAINGKFVPVLMRDQYGNF